MDQVFEYPQDIVAQWKSPAAREITEAIRRKAPASEVQKLVESVLRDKASEFQAERAEAAEKGYLIAPMIGCVPIDYYSLAADRVRKATEDAVIAIEEVYDFVAAPAWQFVVHLKNDSGRPVYGPHRELVQLKRGPQGLYTAEPR